MLPLAPIQLRVQPEPNARNEYRMDLSLIAFEAAKPVGRTDARFTLAERALKIEPESVEFRRFLKPETVMGSGKAGEELAAVYRAIEPTVLPTIVDRRGKTLSIGRGPEATASGTIDVIFPAEPVSVGDTWTTPYGAFSNVVVRCRLEALGPVVGKQVALISITDSEANPEYKSEPGSLFAFDVGDGRWLRVGAAFTLTVGEAKSLRVAYAIARSGAPAWSEILAAFPDAKLPLPPKT